MTGAGEATVVDQVSALRREITEAIAGLRRELKLTWDSHSREHTQHEQSHAREHGFAQDAINKAAEMAKENKADANEWREAMDDKDRHAATKVDIATLATAIDKLEAAELVRAEQERARLVKEADDKRLAERAAADALASADRRQRASQWKIGLGVGVGSMLGSILINLLLRISSTPGGG